MIPDGTAPEAASDEIIVVARPPVPDRQAGPNGAVAFPHWKVTLDGVDVSEKLRPYLMRLRVSERRGEAADQFDIDLDDSERGLAIPKAGAILTIALGWKGGGGTTPGLIDKGSFTVDEAEHTGPPDVITVRGRSADFTAEWRKVRDQTWRNTTLGAVLGDVAARQGVTLKIAASLGAVPLKLVTQSRESDAALLKRLGMEHDAVATVKFENLVFVPMAGGKSASGEALETVTIRRADGDRHSYRIEAREDWTGVVAKWHDKKAAKQKKVRVGRRRRAKSAVPRSALSRLTPEQKKLKGAAKAALRAAREREADARRAARAAERAAAHRKAEANADARRAATAAEKARRAATRAVEKAGKAAGSRDNPKILKKVFPSEAEAQRAAEAEWRRIQRAPRKFSISLALGRPEIGAEQPALALGYHPEIDDQDWIVADTAHTLDGKGLTSTLSFEVPDKPAEGGSESDAAADQEAP
jgi:uncharacterized protein